MVLNVLLLENLEQVKHTCAVDYKKLNSVRHGNCYKVCTPTHKSALIANATTIFNLFKIYPIYRLYLP